MHRTQISLEDEQYAFLAGEARKAGVSIAEWLRRMIAARMREQSPTPASAWPREVLEFTGVPDFEPFESHRAALRPPAEDPLA